MTSSFKSLVVNDTGYVQLPNGTSANRPSPSSTVVVQWTNTGTQAVSVTSGSATTTSTSWTCPTGVSQIEVMVVAAGGGGMASSNCCVGASGAGAGGLIYNSAFPVVAGTSYTVTVGQGSAGANGGNSSFGGLTAIGGGKGSRYVLGGATDGIPGTGGSGAGGAGLVNSADTSYWSGRSGTAGQGFPGGTYYDTEGPTQNTRAAGGGGAGGPGYDSGGDGGEYASIRSAAGGPGVQIAITGTPTYYAGGGGGSVRTNAGGSQTGGYGGLGGGGKGADVAGTGAANGTASTGGGAGGSSGGNGAQGNTTGGSGIVVIRYVFETATTQAITQSRLNTVTGAVESFGTNNTWNQQATDATIIQNGIVLNLDPALYTSGTTWFDTSGFGNNVTLTNSPIFDPNDSGGSFTFNGTNQYGVVGSPVPASLQMAGEFTMSAWVYPTGITSGNLYAIIGCQYDTGTYKGTTMHIDTRTAGIGGNNTVHFQLGDSGTWYASNSSSFPAIRTNAWTNITCVWKRGQRGKVYINGSWLNTTDTSLNNNVVTYSVSGQEYSIGRQNDTGRYFLGKMGAIQVYNRALTGPEVIQNFNALAGRYNKPKLIAAGLGLTPETAAKSASDIKAANPTAASGLYWLQPALWQRPALFYCEMTLHGGGWIYLLQRQCVNQQGLPGSWLTSQSGTQNHASSNFYGVVDIGGTTRTPQDIWNGFIGSGNLAKVYCREIQTNGYYDESQSYVSALDGPVFSWTLFSRLFYGNFSDGQFRTGIRVYYQNGNKRVDGRIATTWSAPSLATINNGSVDQELYFCNGTDGGDSNWAFGLMQNGTPYPRLSDATNGGGRNSVTRWGIIAIKA
jgi:hypothetical protein